MSTLKILHRDMKHGTVKVLIQNLDDLWALYNILERGDFAHGKTTREVKTDGVGRPSSQRKPLSLTLELEKVYFDRWISRLRLLGTVLEAPEIFHIQGAHHTISVSVGDQLTLRKSQWHEHQLDRLRRSISVESPILVVSIDTEEAAVAVVRSFGIDVKAVVRSRLPGKNEPQRREEALEKYYLEVLKIVSSSDDLSESKIVIVGPGFARDGFARYVRDKSKDTAKRIAAVNGVSSAGEVGVQEAIRRGLLSKVYKNARVEQETVLIEEVLGRVAVSKGDVSYGPDIVYDDAASGAVDKILVADEIMREADDAERTRLDQAIRHVEKAGGAVTVISCEHEAGIKLKSLGGVAALLRYARHVDVPRSSS